LGLAGFCGLCLAVVLSGAGLALAALPGWYLRLVPPPLAPAGGATEFLLIWAALYPLLSLAGWLIWRRPDLALRHAAALRGFGIMLGIKALGTAVFFGLHWMATAAILAGLLLLVTGITIARFARLSPPAALLLLPFGLWSAFMVYFIAGFWWLNG
jgi:tryptophan-rich sensory protein